MAIGIDLGGRPCLIVGGAGGGIGTAMAVAAAEAGAPVAVITNVQEHADDSVRRLEQSGAKCAAVVADVTDEAALSSAIADLGHELGPIRHLVNVVGGNLADDWHRAAAFDMAAFDRVVARNLRYAVVACREVARRLIDSGQSGSIVNISSIAVRGTPLLAAYGAAKAGLESFSRTMALEWGPHAIRVNLVAPGTIRTPRAGQGDMIDAAGSIPLRRRGDPEDIACAAMFLLSDLAGYITGHTLTVDGGAILGHPGGEQLPAFVTNPSVRARFAAGASVTSAGSRPVHHSDLTDRQLTRLGEILASLGPGRLFSATEALAAALAAGIENRLADIDSALSDLEDAGVIREVQQRPPRWQVVEPER